MSQTAHLETTRLRLQRYSEDDRSSFVALNTDPVVRQHMGGPMSVETASDRFDSLLQPPSETPTLAWAITEKSTATYLGHAFLEECRTAHEYQLGFLLFETHWRRGFATEAARRVVSHAFDNLDVRTIRATVDTGHLPSHRVLEKAGLRRVSEERDCDGLYFVYAVSNPSGR